MSLKLPSLGYRLGYTNISNAVLYWQEVIGRSQLKVLVRLIRTISLQFIVESQTWYQNDRGVMLISNQSDAKIFGLGSRVIIGLNWPLKLAVFPKPLSND